MCHANLAGNKRYSKGGSMVWSRQYSEHGSLLEAGSVWEIGNHGFDVAAKCYQGKFTNYRQIVSNDWSEQLLTNYGLSILSDSLMLDDFHTRSAHNKVEHIISKVAASLARKIRVLTIRWIMKSAPCSGGLEDRAIDRASPSLPKWLADLNCHNWVRHTVDIGRLCRNPRCAMTYICQQQ